MRPNQSGEFKEGKNAHGRITNIAVDILVHILAQSASSKKRGGGVGSVGIVVDHVTTLSCALRFFLEGVSRGENFLGHSLALVHVQTIGERLHHARRRNKALAHRLDVLATLREGMDACAKRVYGEGGRRWRRRRFWLSENGMESVVSKGV